MDVRRIRTVKRRKEEKMAEKNQIHLERVLGLTVLSNAGLASSPMTGCLAYPAGCTIVLYNARKNRQSHLTNPSRKTFTTVDFSEDGRYLVSGECGHQPHVRVWDVLDRSLVVEFPGHKYGISCVSFAPNDKYVVSVGSQHDMIVNVWDWRGNIKVASNKISAKVKAISFAENGRYFVTAGNRHVKFWYLEYSRSKYQEPTPLTGRSAILGEQRNNDFCDVACGRGDAGDSTFAITKSGLLCEFNNRRLLDKWVELRTPSANCLAVGEHFIFIGCAEGIVRCFSPHTLEFITTLPRTHHLGVDISKGLTISHMASHPPSVKYPDAYAVTFDKSNLKVTVVYNDRSIYIWDVRDINKVGKSQSFMFHSACIWGLEMYPLNNEGQKSVLPPGSFVTCSSDDTIRIWNLHNNMAVNTLYRRNIYSEELLKIIYVDPGLNFIKDNEACKVDADQKPPESVGGNMVYDQRNGVRCIRISPDGKHLASGDRAGNIRVHELQFMDEMCKIEAHDAEVLCIEYSGLCQLPNQAKKKSFLASASRDRLIHVFNATLDYGFLSTLDDHSSSITAIRFLHRSDTSSLQNVTSQLQMVSCGADKSIIFRDVNVDAKGHPEFQRVNHIVGKTTLYDMEVDADNSHILTACQDRNIRVYTCDTGKHSRTFKGSLSEDGTLIKVVLDHSGTYAATSCTDKTLAIYEYATGEEVATVFGHSELVTGLKFTNDCKHLISVAGDGCIFVWRLPQFMTSNMLTRLSRQIATNEHFGPPTPEFLDPNANQVGNAHDYRFSVGKLPVWAKKQMGVDNNRSSRAPPTIDESQGAIFPKGRWGQRVVEDSVQKMTLKSRPLPALRTPQSSGGDEDKCVVETQQIVTKQTFNDDLNDEDYNSMSEMEYYRRGLSPLQGRGVVSLKSGDRVSSLRQEQKQTITTDDSSLGSLNVESTAEHDGDIDEEYSDGLITHDDGGESTEPEQPDKTLFFARQDEKISASEYTINAMDVEELNRSRRNNHIRQQTPSQDSDVDDEDEGLSTPSAENKNRREEDFVKMNFESLSGVEDQSSFSNCTLSNRYREESAVKRNAATIARAQSFRDSEQNKRRELLQKRIEETRKKLQEIGYRSMIRGSQSISDLTTTAADRATPTDPVVSSGYRPPSAEPSNRRPTLHSTSSTSLRRACSLSDISGSQRRTLPATPINVSGKKTSGLLRNNTPRVARKLSREENLSSSPMIPSYMRSTSSSSKKSLMGSGYQFNVGRNPISQSQSTSDIRSAGKGDSSSEEETVGNYRRRSSSHDRRSGGSGGGGGSNRLNNLSSSRGKVVSSERDVIRLREPNKDEIETLKQRPKMKTTTIILNEPPTESLDVVRQTLDWRLIDQTSRALNQASDNLVQLYKRITLDHELAEGLRVQFLQMLVASADAAQHTLRPINPRGPVSSQPKKHFTSSPSGVSSVVVTSSLRPATATSHSSQNSLRPLTMPPTTEDNRPQNKGPSWC